MDVSKEYQKMCDCPEAQVGGYTTLNSEEGIQYVGDNVFVELDRCSTTWRTVRLLRQSQIQEMMPEKNCKCPCCLIFHLNKFVEDNIDGFADGGIDSMEQYWLAFYMWENHQKIWDGKKWVKSGKE